MRVLSIVHQADAGSGVFGQAAAERGDELDGWVPAEAPQPDPTPYGAALVFGGGMDVDQEEQHPWLRAEKDFIRGLLLRRVPILGVCLGAQLVAEVVGARPHRSATPEIGWREVTLSREARDDPLFGPLPERFESFQWHSYEFPLPPGATPLARSPGCLQAFRVGGSAWGIQFHAEVTRDTVEQWLENYGKDDDAVRMGINPAGLLAETKPRIEGWNGLGRGLCQRFLEHAKKA